MEPLASVFIATSLDGFIAREDGSIDWLSKASSQVPKGEDCGYSAFMDTIDTMVMGRNTFEKVLSFGEWPYGKTPLIVLSRKRLEIPEDLSQTVSCSAETPLVLTERLAAAGVRRIYLDGGITIQRFLAAGMVKDMVITVIPILIGSGIPLFGASQEDIVLKHISTRTYDFGFVQSTYEVT